MDQRSDQGVVHHLAKLLRSKSELPLEGLKGSSSSSSGGGSDAADGRSSTVQELAAEPSATGNGGSCGGGGTPTAATLQDAAQAVRHGAAEAAQP